MPAPIAAPASAPAASSAVPTGSPSGMGQLASRVAQKIHDEMTRAKGLGMAAPVPAAPVVITPTLADVAALTEGQQSIRSLVTGYAGVDFGVSVKSRESYPAHLQSQIPTVQADYLPNASAAAEVLLGWENGDKILMSGPSGVGKSSLISHLCALTQRPFVRINLSEDLESAALLGFMEVREGSTHFVLGPVAEAAKFGAVLLLDEYDTASPGVLFALQWLLEDNGKLFLRDMPGTNAERTIDPHGDFRLVAAGNTLGQGDDTGRFAGTRVQNSAAIDRYKTCVLMTYLDPSDEAAIVAVKFPKIDADIIARMVKVAGLMRDGQDTGALSLTVSPRTLFSWAAKLPLLGVHKAFDSAFVNKLPAKERSVAVELLDKAFPR